MKRLLFAAALLASPALADGVTMAPNDPAMVQAVADAQGTLLIFLQHVVDPRGMGPASAALNVAVQTGNADHPVENIWVSPFIFLPDGKVAGLALNSGDYATTVKADKTLTFTKAQIVDWSWRPGDGKVWGEYTTRAFFAATGMEAKEKLGVAFSDPILPPAWK